MNELSNKQALAVIEPRTDGDNGHHEMVATEQLPIAKYVTNEQIIAEEKFLASQEANVEKTVHRSTRLFSNRSRLGRDR